MIFPKRSENWPKKAYAMWKADPRNVSLNFARLGKNLWSGRVGLHYRVLGRKSIDLDSGEEVFVWHWIGNHDAYDRLKRRG